jgi:hypothetical protein
VVNASEGLTTFCRTGGSIPPREAYQGEVAQTGRALDEEVVGSSPTFPTQ